MTHTYSATLSISSDWTHFISPKFCNEILEGRAFAGALEGRARMCSAMDPAACPGGHQAPALLSRESWAQGGGRILPSSGTAAWSTQPVPRQGPRRAGLGAKEGRFRGQKNVFFGSASTFQIPSSRFPSRKDPLRANRQARWTAVPCDCIVTAQF